MTIGDSTIINLKDFRVLVTILKGDATKGVRLALFTTRKN